MSVEHVLLYEKRSSYKNLELKVSVRRGLPELVVLGPLTEKAMIEKYGGPVPEPLKIELIGNNMLTAGRGSKKRGWISARQLEKDFNNANYRFSDLSGLVDAANSLLLEARKDERYPYKK